ncbi:MAG: nucleoside phosphorylase [Candidatus Zixiibacteriota bacterium]
MKQKYPILEFDPERKAIIEPGEHSNPMDIAEHCVICFFREVFDKMLAEYDARLMFEDNWEVDRVQFYEINYEGRRLALFRPYIGAPIAAGMLEQAIALGCRKFTACGGAGVLNRDIAVGHIMVPASAIRDEGTSYHYLPPEREVAASPEAVAAIEQTLKSRHIPYNACKTWTTDAPYRETKDKVELRRDEGCLTVEMEAAAFFAVAQFRNVTFGQILYGGDDVSGENWDERGWASRISIREKLFHLAVESCFRL